MRILLSLFVLCITNTALSQEEQLAILKANTSWGKEIIHFPVDWVPELTLEGFEELRFAPNWGTKDHQNFWSLAMAWQVNTSEFLGLKEIAQNVEYYFDGLMKPNHWATQYAAPNLLLLPTSEKQQYVPFFGKLKVFDGFYTGKIVSLNIKGESIFNPITGKQIVVLRYSPQPFDHPIWEALQNITILN